ncbi:MAG: hypothetical protein GC136_01235 [Alphaproteobacteria bacterium]|nr:hypothetical protein [Alphaproteobacteria bacterium]
MEVASIALITTGAAAAAYSAASGYEFIRDGKAMLGRVRCILGSALAAATLTYAYQEANRPPGYAEYLKTAYDLAVFRRLHRVSFCIPQADPNC